MSNISKEAIARTIGGKTKDGKLLCTVNFGGIECAPKQEYDYAAQQVRELDALVDELQELLGEISGIGISQSAAMNMPSADWYYRLFSTCQRFARDGEKKIKQARGE